MKMQIKKGFSIYENNPELVAYISAVMFDPESD